MMAASILPLVLMLSSYSFASSTDECIAGFYASQSNCTREALRGSAGWITESLCSHRSEQHSKCLGNTTCGKHYRVSVFDQQLFAITLKDAFTQMLTLCCQDCAKCSLVKEIEDTMQLTESILNSSDVIFPVLSDSSVAKLHGFYFLDVYQVPSFYYFTLKKSRDMVISEVIYACVGIWPFLLMCLFFASISGFIVWVIEMKVNREDFSRPFYTGMFDGFWWSFVSMTTVGYGDKVTKSYPGKIYAVIWILAGITMFSMFTGSLTSEIIQARQPASTDMSDKDIAVLKGRMHDMAAVAEHGGILRMGNIGHTMRGIEEMFNLLDNREVHGILMDRNTYYHFSDRTKEPKYSRLATKVRSMNIIKTEKTLLKQDLSCGMMVRDYNDYNYFKTYFDNSRLDIRTCNSVSMNTKGMQLERSTSLFAADDKLYGTIVATCLGVLALTVLIGLFIESKRYYAKVKTRAESL